MLWCDISEIMPSATGNTQKLLSNPLISRIDAKYHSNKRR